MKTTVYSVVDESGVLFDRLHEQLQLNEQGISLELTEDSQDQLSEKVQSEEIEAFMELEF